MQAASSIQINACEWRGPTEKKALGGSRSIKRLDLIFEEWKTQIWVQIPPQFPQTGLQRLLFTCRKYENGEFQPETQPTKLKLSMDQIQSLSLIALVINNGKEESHSVDFQKPPLLDPSQQYCLQVKADSLRLKVTFIKERVRPK